MTQMITLGAPILESKFFDLSSITFAQLDITRIGLSPDKFVPGLLSAIAILVVGFILAYVAAALTRGILKRTSLEQRLAALMSDSSTTASPLQVEKWISSIVFWIVIIFTLIAALQSLQLTAVSLPLQEFLNRGTGFLPSIVGALLLAGIAWALATVVRLIVTRSLRAFGLDRRLQQLSADTTTEGPAISETLGNILFALVLLLFLPLILDALGLTVAAQPVLAILNQGLGVLLNVIGAGVIALIGWFIARFTGQLVANLLSSTGVDRFGRSIGLNPSPEGQSLSQIGGTVVYVAILIPIAIAALQVLKIEAISVPAISMLNQILNALPKVFTAAVILAISFFAGQFIGRLVTGLLSGLGFNNIFTLLGLPAPAAPSTPSTSSTATDQSSSARSPADIAGIVTTVGIVLFGVVTATDVLQLPALTAIVRSMIKVLGQILSSLVVFGVGLYLANLAFNLITASGSRQSRILGHTARIAIIALILAMALRQMGVAPDIVNLAFGLLLGAIAVAIALAFGLGGRDIAAEQVREWLGSFKQQPTAPLSTAPAASPSAASLPGPPLPGPPLPGPPDEDIDWPPLDD
jgi:Conserved TM helix